MSASGRTVNRMGKHRTEDVPQGTTYGPAFPLMAVVALAIVETIARLNPGCWSLGFC